VTLLSTVGAADAEHTVTLVADTSAGPVALLTTAQLVQTTGVHAVDDEAVEQHTTQAHASRLQPAEHFLVVYVATDCRLDIPGGTCWLSVAPTTTDLLPVGHDGRQLAPMNNLSHVSNLHAHAESHSGYDHSYRRIWLSELCQCVLQQIPGYVAVKHADQLTATDKCQLLQMASQPAVDLRDVIDGSRKDDRLRTLALSILQHIGQPDQIDADG